MRKVMTPGRLSDPAQWSRAASQSSVSLLPLVLDTLDAAVTHYRPSRYKWYYKTGRLAALAGSHTMFKWIRFTL